MASRMDRVSFAHGRDSESSWEDRVGRSKGSPERRRDAASLGFKCGHCKQFIGSLPSGGHHRNHCPACLYSRHVDGQRSGDRASTCGALMEPVGAFVRPKNGEHVLVHRCLGCGLERFNRIAADDNFDLVLALPQLPPRSARPGDEAS
jgi:RNHCP domain